VLCLNSDLEEDAQYKKNWDKYYPTVINKDLVDQYRYFFAVIESQILEWSCVLFGANINSGVYSTSEAKAADEALETEPADDKSLKESNKKFIYCS
jgi:hypothetical protein